MTRRRIVAGRLASTFKARAMRSKPTIEADRAMQIAFLAAADAMVAIARTGLAAAPFGSAYDWRPRVALAVAVRAALVDDLETQTSNRAEAAIACFGRTTEDPKS